MQDDMIVELFWKRDESALSESEAKYSGYLKRIAMNIIANLEDAKEVVNETLFHAWNSIPPQRPDILRTYLGKIARELSLDRYRASHRQKRIASEFTVSLDELDDLVSDSGGDIFDSRLLGEAVDAYLKGVPYEARTAFVQRYYFADTLREIAARQGCTESKVKSMLYRTRQGLRAYLEKEGFSL